MTYNNSSHHLVEKLKFAFEKIHPVFVVILLFMMLVALSLLNFDYPAIACDKAEYLNNPLRILNGDLPYRDFWLLFTPGEVYFPALIYKTFGLNIDIVRIFTILISCSAIIVLFYIGREFFNDNLYASIMSVIFFYVSVINNYEGPDYIHLEVIFTLLSLLFLIKYFKKSVAQTPPSVINSVSSNLFIHLSGIAIGCAFFFRLYEVGAAFTAFLISLLIFVMSYQDELHMAGGAHLNSLPPRLKPVIYYLSGSALVALIVAISFLNILPKMLSEVFIESPKNGTSMNLPYFYIIPLIFDSIKEDMAGITSSGHLVSLMYLVMHLLKLIPTFFHYIIPLISIFFLFIFLKSKPDKTVLCISLSLFFWGMFSVPKGLGRSDIGHVAVSSAPLFLFIFYTYMHALSTFSSIVNHQSSIINRISGILARTTILAMSLSVLYPVFTYTNIILQPRTFVNTKHGKVGLKFKKDAENFKKTVDYIEANTSENDYIFVTIWNSPPIYTLTNRKNPTYYDSLNDLLVRHSDSKQLMICDDLKKHKTKLIVHNADWGYDDKPEQQFKFACPIIQDFIVKNYTLVATFGEYNIYQLTIGNL